jgi:hypothetical protein
MRARHGPPPNDTARHGSTRESGTPGTVAIVVAANLQELDAIDHLLGGEYLGNQHGASDEDSGTGIRRGEQNAWGAPAAARRR